MEGLMLKPLLVGGAAAAFFASNVYGVNPTIVVPDVVLLPNRAGQTVLINVTGGTAVSGLNFNVEVAGGGTVNGGTVGPSITNVNLVAGTIFSANNSGQQNIAANSPQVFEGGIDTSGFRGSTFSLKLTGFGSAGASGNTDFAIDGNLNPIPASVTNGNIIALYPGDANMDGSVNFADFSKLTQTYGNNTGGTWATGDFNFDGSVNFADFSLLTQTYGNVLSTTPPPPSAALPSLEAAAVPEPVGILGAMLGLLAVRRRRIV
jgi:hypothetical protein